MKDDFEFFWNGIYSQWFYADMVIDVEAVFAYFRQRRKGDDTGISSEFWTSKQGKKFITAEQWMMYAKARLFGDDVTAAKILKAKTPKEQKALGRGVDGFDEAVWVKFREDIVFIGNMAKYHQNPDLKAQLLAVPLTKKFVEASPVDKIWGIGRAEDDKLAWEEKTWNGLNLLGKVHDRCRLEFLNA